MSSFYQRLGKALLAAHRGWRTIRPENTISAFEAALGHFDLIELDIQLSRDGEWIVCHDPSLERTTDVEHAFPKGIRPRRVGDYTLEELRRLDAGGWFLRRDPYGTIASGRVSPAELEALGVQRLPTLREVFAFSRAHRIPLNIEIKDMPTERERTVVTRLLRVLENSASASLLISSFNHRYLKLLKEIAPELPTAALVEAEHPPRLIDYLTTLGVEAYHVEDALAETTPVSLLHEHGISSAVYTVNDSDRAGRLFRSGFVGIFCDRPF